MILVWCLAFYPALRSKNVRNHFEQFRPVLPNHRFFSIFPFHQNNPKSPKNLTGDLEILDIVWNRIVAQKRRTNFGRNFDQNFDFRPKILIEGPNFDGKSKFWSKIENLLENQNFGQKSKICSKIVIMVKNRNFGQKSEFWLKIRILVKNPNFGRKSKFWSKIEILVGNRNFVQKSKF